MRKRAIGYEFGMVIEVSVLKKKKNVEVRKQLFFLRNTGSNHLNENTSSWVLSLYCEHSSKYNCSGISTLNLLQIDRVDRDSVLFFFPVFVRHNVKKYGNGKNLNYKY